MLAADFDNDGTLEILLLNAVYKSPFNTGISVRSENALYRVHVTNSGVVLKNISAGDVKISSEHITGNNHLLCQQKSGCKGWEQISNPQPA